MMPDIPDGYGSLIPPPTPPKVRPNLLLKFFPIFLICLICEETIGTALMGITQGLTSALLFRGLMVCWMVISLLLWLTQAIKKESTDELLEALDNLEQQNRVFKMLIDRIDQTTLNRAGVSISTYRKKIVH